MPNTHHRKISKAVGLELLVWDDEAGHFGDEQLDAAFAHLVGNEGIDGTNRGAHSDRAVTPDNSPLPEEPSIDPLQSP